MSTFEPTAWTDEMSVGVDAIDNDHKKLLSLLNEMEYIINADVASNNGAIESVLSELIDYTDYHFDREEVLMEACGYPELENHKQVHEALKGQAHNLLNQFRQKSSSYSPKAILIFLNDWLVEHILGMDKDYELWMQKKIDAVENANAIYEQTIPE